MRATEPIAHRHELSLGLSPVAACAALRDSSGCSLLFDGAGWIRGPLLALSPRQRSYRGDEVGDGLAAVERLVAQRRTVGGAGETGVALLLSYDLFRSRPVVEPRPPELVVLTVDRSLRFVGGDRALLTVRGDRDEALADRVGKSCSAGQPEGRPATVIGRPRTSLPRRDYLRSVERVQEHIGRGDIYQANLCQRFDVDYAGDPLHSHALLTGRTPAPHSAFVETPEFSMASISPETFLRAGPDGSLETWPIKGTRPRGRTEEEDRAIAASLLLSEKDRAELLMIVDLERNDLSRVCVPGSVEVPELVGLRSYPAVHHLVSHVRGRLVPDTGLRELLRATFPGGSITGAPKIRAMQILEELEPVTRGFFTGSLLWLADDGSLDSSILIRTWLFGRGRAWLGAGGGVVADSEPEAEWQESNHKARALSTALGFDPEEAA